MKIVHRLPDEPELVVVTTTALEADPAENLATPVGVGNPFLVFEGLPQEVEASPAADFSGAPLVSADAAENRAAIDAMLASPPTDKVWAA